jgi:predicted DNA-binding protein (MmcQ/YjbR family)
MKGGQQLARAAAALRRRALTYPEAYEEHPWGETAIKVKGKVFLFLYQGDFLSMSMKLPVSGQAALGLAFAAPTGYGLGKSGWVTARFEKGQAIPTEMLLEWLDESYRAVAPKRVVAQLEDGPPAPRKPKRRSKA